MPKLLFSHLFDFKVDFGYFVGAKMLVRFVLSIILLISLIISSTSYKLPPMKSIYSNLSRLLNAFGLFMDSRLFPASDRPLMLD